MDDSSCYVFKTKRDRPAKRRRLESHFTEEDESRRHELFEQSWRLQEQRVNEAISATNENSLRDVVLFLDTASQIRRRCKLPTALIVTGPTASTSFFEEVQRQATENNDDLFVSLTPSDGPNLRSLLKSLISQVTQQQRDLNDEGDTSRSQFSGPKLLSYDLRTLQDWVQRHGVQHLIVNLKRSETFDVAVLSDLVQLLHSWLDRLPVVLLISIATSVDIFQERLPQSTIQCMQGERVDISESSQVVEDVFRSCSASSGARLHLGPDVAAALMERNRDHLPSLEAFQQAVKYAYMCHFHGNPLSVYLKPGIKFEEVDRPQLDAVRKLPSFQQYVEQLLDRKKVILAKNVLRSDLFLFQELVSSCQSAQVDIEWFCGALSIVQSLRHVSSRAEKGFSTPFSSLYIKAFSGSLTPTSPIIRNLLLSLRMLPSEDVAAALSNIVDTLMSMPPSNVVDVSPDSFLDIQSELSILVSEHGSLTAPTTVSAARGRLPVGSSKKAPSEIGSPGKPASRGHMTPAQQYGTLLTRFHAILTAYFTATLPKTHYTRTPFVNDTASSTAGVRWFPHEIIVLNTRSLHVGAFTPAPRAAIERALARPGDYLGEDSCRDAGRHPASAILYQLYCESGVLINVADLWTAFRTRVAPGRDAPPPVSGAETMNSEIDIFTANGPTQGEKECENEELQEREDVDGVIRALFSRSLAELKYLGMVKQSRKKADCMQKVLWPGV